MCLVVETRYHKPRRFRRLLRKLFRRQESKVDVFDQNNYDGLAVKYLYFDKQTKQWRTPYECTPVPADGRLVAEGEPLFIDGYLSAGAIHCYQYGLRSAYLDAGYKAFTVGGYGKIATGEGHVAYQAIKVLDSLDPPEES